MKQLSLTIALTLLCTATYAEEGRIYGDLAFATRYSELCTKYDENANDWAVELYQEFEKLGLDFKKGAAAHMDSVNYNRGLVDGYVAALSDMPKACRWLKKYIETKR